MIDLDSLYSEFEDDIKSEVDSLSMSLPLSGAQLKKAFTSEEIKKLDELLGAVQAARFENEKITLLTNEGNLVLKLMSALGVTIGL